jgi:hypothetical protein
LLFILFRHDEALGLLQSRYHGGEAVFHADQFGNPAFVSYAVSPPDYVFLLPAPEGVNIWELPGWWLIGVGLAGMVGWVAGSHRRPPAEVMAGQG